MKRFFTFCCAILGMGATMYGASADLSDYLDSEVVGEGSSSFTITTNEYGTLTFSGSYTDADDDSNGSYSVSFNIAAEANSDDDEGDDTYTVTMSNFAISGSLSSAFSGETVTASAKGITYIKVSAGEYYDNYGLLSSYLPITIEGQGNGTNPKDISKYLKLLDLLGGDLSLFASAVTVTMTCTSNATLSISVGDEETITCAFAVDEDGTPSFSAVGLENIFDTLTVKGEIETIYAGETDVTEDVIAKEDIDILSSFGTSGYGSEFTYDSDTNTATIVYTGSWSGRGIWGGYYGSGLDYTGYAGIQLIFSPVDPGYYQIQIEYNNETSTEEASTEEASTEEASTAKADGDNVGIQVDNYNATVYLFYEFDYDYAVSDIKQIYLQSENPTTVTLTTATILVNAEDGVTKVEGGTEPTSISSIQTKDAVEVARYNLMGQKLSGAERGINIIVYSDGSAKKVLVK